MRRREPSRATGRAKAWAAAAGRLAATLAAQVEVRDVLVVAGLAAVWRGVAALSAPWAWIVLGALLLYLGVWHTLIETGRRR